MTIFLVPLRISFILKFLKDTNVLWNMEATWFLLLVHKYYSFFQDFKFLGSCVGTLSNHRWFQFPFPQIWWGNSKSNGGPISLFLLHNKFLVSEIRFPPKTLIQSLKRPPFKSFLITFYYHDLLLPLMKISKCISKCSDKKFQKLCFSFDDDTASSAFLGDHNENMCYGLSYTSLE